MSELTTNQKGAIAETAVVHAATRLGIEVYRPVSEGGRFDFIFLLASRLVRVQCKWAARHGDVLLVRCYSARRTRDGIVTRRYGPDEIDAFAAYCPDVHQCYFLWMSQFAGQSRIQLRLEPSRNNQQAGVHWAEDYEFAATLGAENALGP